LNSEQDITQLYNSLFQLEARFKEHSAYPIHKKLYFKNQFNDIYDYLISKIDIKEKTVLDAGCGVGFGSFLFVKNGAKHVTGISVSDEEINRANETKSKLIIENCSFEKATFDTISHPYDIIFCVESLKHSLDFQKSLSNLLKCLSENGKLVIVDDFFDGCKNNISNSLEKNWHLNVLLKDSDIVVNENTYSVEQEDLTKFMRIKSFLKIYVQLAFFRFFKRNSPYRKLFKGGILLDYLYTRKQMQYKLLVISKK
jgi:SAM-dependent methyltransferase